MAAQFNAAFEDASKLDKSGKKGTATQDEQLDLYAWGKIGKGQEVEKPGMFDFKRKAMYGAWEKAKNNGVTKEQAQKNYVDLVKKLATRVGYEEGYKPKLK